jgi:hypothetical protein
MGRGMKQEAIYLIANCNELQNWMLLQLASQRYVRCHNLDRSCSFGHFALQLASQRYVRCHEAI